MAFFSLYGKLLIVCCCCFLFPSFGALWGFLLLHARLLPLHPLSDSSQDISRIGTLSSFKFMAPNTKFKSQSWRRISAPSSLLTLIFLLPFPQPRLRIAPLPRTWASSSFSGIVVVALKFMCVAAPFWGSLAVKIAAVLSGSLRAQLTPWSESCAPSSTTGEGINHSRHIPPPIQIHVTRRSSRIG